MERMARANCRCGWVLMLCKALALGGCFVGQGEQREFIDADGDRVGLGEDCDPMDPEVGSERMWYLDRDADGYGDSESKTMAGCTAPAGHTEKDGDCDDWDETRHPGALEVCDETDNDCNESADDNPLDALTYYRDGDADTFGDLSMAYSGCNIPQGYVGNAEAGHDCDDDNAHRYPGAPEICDDGLVQDCMGTEEAAGETCFWSGDVEMGATGTVLLSENSGALAGYAVSTAGDMNGDGLDDLILGAPLYSLEDEERGAAFIVLGTQTGTISLESASARLLGEDRGDHAGWSVSTAGDADGDGYTDILVGAPAHHAAVGDEGATYIVSSPVVGDFNLGASTTRLLGEDGGDISGWSISLAGDTDDNGYADLLVGAPDHSGVGYDEGAAYLILGPVSGDLDLGVATARLSGERSEDYAGWSASIAGDVNSDGLEDLLVGAPGYSGGVDQGGAAYLASAPLSGDMDLQDATARLLGEESNDRAGWSVSTAGDVDADGYADLLVGSPDHFNEGTHAGAAYLVRGPVSGSLELENAHAQFYGEESNDQSGWAVSTAGDVDNNGCADLLVGAPHHNGVRINEGAIYLMLGPVTGTFNLRDTSLRFLGENVEDWAGTSVSTAGDVNGDGRSDLLLGAPGANTEAGSAYLLLSSSY